jgi:hypothetical protein
VSGVTAGPDGDIGRGALGAGERGGSFDLAVRLRRDFAADFAALALRADVLVAPRLATLRLRADAARLVLRPPAFARFAFLAFCLFAIMTSC